ncbi:MAG: trimethylamine methyltransferase family protein [Anaerolineales bacterium]|nr:trimethylamine methyltransferase family protein [Anaerolineales bacterium]
MNEKGFTRNFKPLEMLTADQVKAIQKASLRVLADTGITFEDAEARQILAENKCQVDEESKRVRFPEDLVKENLDQCLDSFRIRARDAENDLYPGNQGKVFFLASCGLNSINLDTWQPKRPTRKDFYDYVKVLDALPNIHALPAFPWWGFDKVPQVMSLLESNAAKMRMSTKIQSEGAVAGNERWTLAMAKATNQDLLQLVNPTAPLTFSEETLQKLINFVKDEIVFAICSGPVPGATAPATVAGGLVTGNAEHLAGIVLANLVKPGPRLISANMTMMQNMRSGAPYFSQAGNMVLDGAFHQVWRDYGVPSWSTMPAWTGSKAIDFQAAYETAMAAVSSAMCGSMFLVFQGGLTQQLIAHPIKAILDDDVAGMVGRILQGVDVNDETLALDVIDQVGPLPGTFLTTAHTRKWWRKEQYIPQVADHLSQEDWLAAGSKTPIDHAREKMEHILATHQTAPLLPEQEQAIEDILNDARQYYRKLGAISDEEWAAYQEDLSSPDYPYS